MELPTYQSRRCSGMMIGLIKADGVRCCEAAFHATASLCTLFK